MSPVSAAPAPHGSGARWVCAAFGSGPPSGARGGVTVLARDQESGALHDTGWKVPLPAAAYLAIRPQGTHVYVADETADGRVVALRLRPERAPAWSSECGSGGAEPCYIAVHPSGGLLAAANYGSGSVALLRIGPDGELADVTDVVPGGGSGPDRERQNGPHPHCAAFLPSGRHLIVADLGTDTVSSYTVDTGRGRLIAAGRVTVPAGCGPRHVVSADGVLYVTGELDSSVLALPFDAASGSIGLPSVTGASQRGTVDRNYPSDIVSSPTGRHCYVANRGADTVTMLTRHGQRLTLAAEIPSGGQWPVQLARTGGHLYIANQHSDSIAQFALGPSEIPTPQPSALTLPRPACLLPLPRGTAMSG